MTDAWRIVKVVDGDTFHVEGTVVQTLAEAWPGLELEMAVIVREKVRVAHCNAPEMNTQAGKDARAAVMGWLAAQPVEMVGHGRDKYGRWLADARRSDGSLLSAFVLTLPGSVPMGLAALRGEAAAA